MVVVRKLEHGASFAFLACCAPLDEDDLRELRALVDQAFDLRDGPYLRDACEHIVDWRARTNLRHLERDQEHAGSALRLLRESSHLVEREKREKRERHAA